jgi:integrase
MQFVEPIRDPKRIAHIKNLLKGQNHHRDLLLFVMGINTALRISDLLRITIGDLVNNVGNIRSQFWVKEQKRGKRREVVINASIREALVPYLDQFPEITDNPHHFVFFNFKSPPFTVPIKRGQAWKIITTICHDAGLQGRFGTHSLRKTWGYHARKQGVDLSLIMYQLNQLAPDVHQTLSGYHR